MFLYDPSKCLPNIICWIPKHSASSSFMWNLTQDLKIDDSKIKYKINNKHEGAFFPKHQQIVLCSRIPIANDISSFLWSFMTGRLKHAQSSAFDREILRTLLCVGRVTSPILSWLWQQSLPSWPSASDSQQGSVQLYGWQSCCCGRPMWVRSVNLIWWRNSHSSWGLFALTDGIPGSQSAGSKKKKRVPRGEIVVIWGIK